jgi:hypothetical protein
MLHNILRAAAATVSLAFKSSAVGTSTAGTIVAPTGIVAGDIIVLYDNAANNSTLPAALIPSGFVGILNNTLSTNRRVICSYKIATGSESGTTITGMSVNNVVAKIMLVFSINRASPVTVKSVQYEATDGDPVAQVIPSGSGTAPLVAIGFNRNTSGTGISMSPTEDGSVVNSGHFGYYKIYNSNPATNVTFDGGDGGVNNMLMSFYLETTNTPPSLTYSASYADNSSQTTRTISSVNFGTPSPTREIFVVARYSGSSNPTLNSVTMVECRQLDQQQISLVVYRDKDYFLPQYQVETLAV